MFKYHNKTYIQCNRDTSVRSWNSKQRAIEYFERGYNRNHTTSPESSRSACFHYISFNPKVLTIKGPTDLIGKVIVLPAQTYICSTIAGSLRGIECVGPDTEKLYESAYNIRLISRPTLLNRITSFIKR